MSPELSPIQTTQKPELRQRERMSDQELGDLLAAVGNHEAKALTLLFMDPNRVYARSDLHRKLMELQGGFEGWKISHDVPFAYCERSLSPIGLVTREVINPDLSTFGYIKTDSGRVLGDSLSGHLLTFSEKYPEISLIDLFGRTASKSKAENAEKKRSPATRLKIYWELVTSELPIRKVELEKQTQTEPSVLTVHLEELKSAGIISYESVSADSPIIIYKLPDDFPEELPEALIKNSSYPTLKKIVYSVIIKNPEMEITADSIYDLVNKEYPERKKLSKTSQRIGLRNILLDFSNAGLLLRTGKFDKVYRSEIDVDSIMLLELVTILDRFQSLDGEFIEEGRRKGRELLVDPKRVASLLSKAKEHSPQANPLSREDACRQIESILSKNPNISARDVKGQLAEISDKRFSFKFVEQIMRHMTAEGKLITKKEGSANRYSLRQERSSLPSSDTVFSES